MASRESRATDYHISLMMTRVATFASTCILCNQAPDSDMPKLTVRMFNLLPGQEDMEESRKMTYEQWAKWMAACARILADYLEGKT